VKWLEAKTIHLLHVVNAREEGGDVVVVGTPKKFTWTTADNSMANA
jgi:carotenoid cleavage dioxygenase-like enzyme